jgi:pimeloyl-ACP methyl ester carboxylesterase
MPRITVRGVSLYFEQHGDPRTPRVLVAHGLMGSIAYTNRLGQRLDTLANAGLQVTAYDARGHGRSEYTTDRADYHWTSLAEDMHAFIEALGLAPVTVYGGSMGAGTALSLALAHPGDIARLALLVPPPFGDDLPPVARTFAALATSYRFLGVPLTARIAAYLARRRGLQPDAIAELRRFLGSQRRSPVVPAIRGLLLGQPQLPVERFHEIAVPTLVMTQPRDPIHPLASGETLRRELPHARLAVAPEPEYWNAHADHLAALVAAFARDDPAALAAAIANIERVRTEPVPAERAFAESP